MRTALAAVAVLLVFCSAAMAGSVGPSPYLSFADSPWSGYTGTYFHNEDFEDGLLNTPGLGVIPPPNVQPTSSYLTSSNPSFAIYIDSVDGDDGSIDGSGSTGESWFSTPGHVGLTFTFSAAVLGALPTHAGLVWTDGDGVTTFEAFDAGGVSLGTMSLTHASPNTYTGETDSDRFYGWTHAGGISKILIKNSSGGIEVDHVQYGHNLAPTGPQVPLPAAAWLGLGLLGLLGAGRRLRRS